LRHFLVAHVRVEFVTLDHQDFLFASCTVSFGSDKMHQHPRPPPRMASPASSPRTNPNRTNNPREEIRGAHARVSSDVPTYSEQDNGIGTGDNDITSTGPSREAVKKLDQIIQVILGFSYLINNILTGDRTSTRRLQS
jgi:hypothetical protein